MVFIAVPLSCRQIRPPRRTQRPRRRQDGNLWTCCYAAQSSMTRPAAEPAGGATLQPVASGYRAIEVAVDCLRPWPFENSSARRARRNISKKWRIMRANAAHIRLDPVLENCIFHISAMHEFSHSQDPERSSRRFDSRSDRDIAAERALGDPRSL